MIKHKKQETYICPKCKSKCVVDEGIAYCIKCDRHMCKDEITGKIMCETVFSCGRKRKYDEVVDPDTGEIIRFEIKKASQYQLYLQKKRDEEIYKLVHELNEETAKLDRKFFAELYKRKIWK
jgi:hypothetical protein